jgi:hypothetical protein
MAKLSIPTTRTSKPPLLIDAEQLQSLDKVIDRYLPRLYEHRDRDIAEKLLRKTRDYLRDGKIRKEAQPDFEARLRRDLIHDASYRDTRNVSIYLTKGKEIQDQTFSEAMNQPVDENEIAVGFSLRIRVGEIAATVKLAERWIKEMEVEVEPKDHEVAQALFGALANWSSAVEAPRWQQKWASYKWLSFALFFAWLFMAAISFPLSVWSESGKNASRVEARKLLEAGGVNANNEQRAIALILAIESDYSPPGVRRPILGVKYWTYVSLSALLLLALSICPEVCIGLWRGKRRLRAWRLWMSTITIGVPALVGTYVLIPWILYWLKLVPPSN